MAISQIQHVHISLSSCCKYCMCLDLASTPSSNWTSHDQVMARLAMCKYSYPAMYSLQLSAVMQAACLCSRRPYSKIPTHELPRLQMWVPHGPELVVRVVHYPAESAISVGEHSRGCVDICNTCPQKPAYLSGAAHRQATQSGAERDECCCKERPGGGGSSRKH